MSARVSIHGMDVVPAGGDVSGVVANARGAWAERRGLIVTVRDGRGRAGVGEASPLPGFSPDTLDACEAALAAVSLPAALELADVPSVCAAVPAPAARFALETALLDLLGQSAGIPVAALLAGLASLPIAPAPLCALVTDLAAGLDHVAHALARGIRCIKVKVGRPGCFDDELAFLRAVRARHGDALSVRLDANRAWTPAQAAHHLERLAEVAPEYIEEPTGDLFALGASPVPLAVDESLAAMEPGRLDALLASGLVRAVVLKPMVLGGSLPCLALAARARVHGAAAVVSHLFDGPVALAACAHLAVLLHTACGLDRHPGLGAFPALDVPHLGADRVKVPVLPGLGLAIPAWSRHTSDP